MDSTQPIRPNTPTQVGMKQVRPSAPPQNEAEHVHDIVKDIVANKALDLFIIMHLEYSGSRSIEVVIDPERNKCIDPKTVASTISSNALGYGATKVETVDDLNLKINDIPVQISLRSLDEQELTISTLMKQGQVPCK